MLQGKSSKLCSRELPLGYELSFHPKLCRPEGRGMTGKGITGGNLQPKILYLSRLSFRFEGEIKIFTGKQKLKVVSTMKSALQDMLKGLL